jgi:hypothetical protein
MNSEIGLDSRARIYTRTRLTDTMNPPCFPLPPAEEERSKNHFVWEIHQAQGKELHLGLLLVDTGRLAMRSAITAAHHDHQRADRGTILIIRIFFLSGTQQSRGVACPAPEPGRFRARRDSEALSNLTAYDAARTSQARRVAALSAVFDPSRCRLYLILTPGTVNGIVLSVR